MSNLRLSAFALGLVLMTGPALAACPVGEDYSDIRATLHTDLLNAPDEPSARQVANALWEIWLTAPDETAQALLDRGMERRVAYDYAAAEEALDELVAYCPAYVEGFNQRAFVRFLRNDYEGSLEDLEKVLVDNPYHFGALSGRALNLMSIGRMELAQTALREAVAVHPYLAERAYLIEDPDEKL